jgi:hypothetical protein
MDLLTERFKQLYVYAHLNLSIPVSLHQFFVGMMISKQPLYIQGINPTNQEITKESAFGAMGMFIFLFSTSVVYLCYHKFHDEEDVIR